MELHLPLHLGVVAIEKGAFGSLSTKVTNFTYLSVWSQKWLSCSVLNLHVKVRKPLWIITFRYKRNCLLGICLIHKYSRRETKNVKFRVFVSWKEKVLFIRISKLFFYQHFIIEAFFCLHRIFHSFVHFCYPCLSFLFLHIISIKTISNDTHTHTHTHTHAHTLGYRYLHRRTKRQVCTTLISAFFSNLCMMKTQTSLSLIFQSR